jgi:phage-related protein
VAQSPARTAGPDDNLEVMIRPFDSGGSWVVSDYRQANGHSPVRTFLSGLGDADLDRAAALVRLLGERGANLRAPHSKPLGQGLFELRDVPSGVRIFYVTAPGRRLVLLDGIVKKRQGIPARTLDRLRRFQADVAECVGR